MPLRAMPARAAPIWVRGGSHSLGSGTHHYLLYRTRLTTWTERHGTHRAVRRARGGDEERDGVRDGRPDPGYAGLEALAGRRMGFSVGGTVRFGAVDLSFA